MLVDEELARAVRCELALAIGYWWGVTEGVVWRWRKALGVTRTNNEGSRLLCHAAAVAGAEVNHRNGLTEEQCDQRREAAIRLNLGRYLKTGYHGPHWKPKQIALLGKLTDEEVARRTGRTVGAVRIMRTRLGIATVHDRRRGRKRARGFARHSTTG